MIKTATFCLDFFFFPISSNLIGKVLKNACFFRNPGITKVLAVERDIKPRNMTFAKVKRKGASNREGRLFG